MISTVEHRLRRIEEKSVAFKVGATGALGEMDKAHDDSDLSGVSDIGALENETDDFGRRILQHHRDTHRLNNALRTDGKPFRKERPRPRIAGLNGLDGSHNVHGHQRTGSGGSSGTDPPLNVPSQWGRRARKQAGWLRELRESIDMNPAGTSRPASTQEVNPVSSRDAAHSRNDDWDPAADAPLASIEHTPPSMRRHRADTTPSSLRHMNTTLQAALASDDQDFSTVDLLTSTPAVNRRNRRIDQLTMRETEFVEHQDIAKRTLDQILSESSAAQMDQRPVTAPPRTSASPLGKRTHVATNKENIAPSGEMHRSQIPVRDGTKPLKFKQPATSTAHSRTDSYNLLKQLARVSSSPSPGKNKAEREAVEKRRETRNADDLPLSARSTNSDYISGEKLRILAQRQPYPTPDAEQDVVKSQSRNAKQVEADVVTASAEQRAEAKTPVVTGAWVDTPGAKRDTAPNALLDKMASMSKDEQVESPLRRVQSEPGHGKSALADVLKDMKAQPNALYGDTTMQSLEDIVNPNLDPTDPEMTKDADEAVDDREQDDRELTQAEKDRRQERLAIEAMNKHLRAARTSIKDANRGLRRVENKIEGVDAVAPAVDELAKVAPIAPQIRTGTSGKTVCEHCGGTYYGSVWKALWIEFRSNFYTYPGEAIPAVKASARRPRWWHNKYIHLTTLGLITSILLAYLMMELFLCDIYCHKRYARTMVGFGVDPNAPIFPFVIPTLLFRPFRPLWKPVVDWLEWILWECWRWLTESDVPSTTGRKVTHPRVLDDDDMGRQGWGNDFAGTTITKAFTNTVWEHVGMATVAASQNVWAGMQQKYDDADSMWDDESV